MRLFRTVCVCCGGECGATSFIVRRPFMWGPLKNPGRQLASRFAPSFVYCKTSGQGTKTVSFSYMPGISFPWFEDSWNICSKTSLTDQERFVITSALLVRAEKRKNMTATSAPCFPFFMMRKVVSTGTDIDDGKSCADAFQAGLPASFYAGRSWLKLYFKKPSHIKRGGYPVSGRKNRKLVDLHSVLKI